MEQLNRNEIKEILQKAKTIAVVGLANKPDRPAYMVAQYLQNAGYKIIPVNPKAEEVLGEKAVASLLDIKEHIDIVNIFRRPSFLPELAEQFLQIDADVFWTQLAIVDENVFQLLKEKGKQVIMDRCTKIEHAMMTR